MATNPLSEFMSGVKKLWFVATGAAADNAAVSGNPLLIGGRYSTTPATRHDGDVATIETDSQGRVLTVVSGRKLALTAPTAYGQALNVAASGSTTITITPPAGELWRLKLLYLRIARPTSSTTGTHGLYMYQGMNDSLALMLSAKSNFGDSIEVQGNRIKTATATSGSYPDTEANQRFVIQELVASNASPLFITYTNLTDVSQTGTLSIYLSKEVEYIV